MDRPISHDMFTTSYFGVAIFSSAASDRREMMDRELTTKMHSVDSSLALDNSHSNYAAGAVM